jgi:tetratricopeptide (TPR) repeat protein
MLRNVITIASFGLLVFASDCFAAMANERSANRLCVRDAALPTVLIGRFLIADQLAAKQLPEKTLIYAVADALRVRQVMIPTVWDQDLAGKSQVAPWINEIFVRGASDDNLTSRISRDLAAYLRENDCDYLVGGQVTADGPLIGLTPFILIAREEKFEPGAKGPVKRPFGAILQTEPVSANRLAEAFGARFSVFVAQVRAPNQIFIGCFTDRSGKRNPALTNLARSVTGTKLANSLKGTISIIEERVPCEGAALPWGDKPTARLGGEVTIRGKQTELLTTIQLPIQGTRLEFRSAGPSTAFKDIVDGQSDHVVSFFAAITKPDGSWPSSTSTSPFENPIASIEALIAQGDKEAAALVAYKLHFEKPSDPVANFALGRALTNKGLYSAAIGPLKSALASNASLSNAQQALTLEALGESMAATGAPQTAITYFTEAQNKYAAGGDAAGISRSARQSALLLAKANNVKDAQERLLQIPHIKEDKDSAFLLSQIMLMVGNVDGASEWLEHARKLSPSDDRIASAGANVFAFLGDRALTARDFRAAISYLEKSASYKESSRVRYAAGYAAAEDNNHPVAIAHFEKAIAAATGDNFGLWAEASWLGLLESHLLLKDFEKLERFGKEASEIALSRTTAPRLLALYMRLIGRVSQGNYADVTQLESDSIFQEIETVRRVTSLKDFAWNNDAIRSFLKTSTAPPEQANLLLTLTETLFPSPHGDNK